MPLIEIFALPQPDPGVVPRVLDALVEEVAAAVGARPEGVWVVWHDVEPGAYAAGPSRPDVQPRDSHPPLVRVFVNRPPDATERALEAIERVIARELGLGDATPFVIVDQRHEG
jgi:hypothetical protein